MRFDENAEKITVITAFLAMCVKERQIWNGHDAMDVWTAWTQLLGLAPATASEMLCKMLGDEPSA